MAVSLLISLIIIQLLHELKKSIIRDFKSTRLELISRLTRTRYYRIMVDSLQHFCRVFSKDQLVESLILKDHTLQVWWTWCHGNIRTLITLINYVTYLFLQNQIATSLYSMIYITPSSILRKEQLIPIYLLKQANILIRTQLNM